MESLKIKNIRVLRLNGTRKERAQYHGQIVASLTEKERDTLAYTPLSQKNQSLIKRAGQRVPGIGKFASGLYEAFVLERFLRLPKIYRKRIKPFTDGANVSMKSIWLSLYQPDMLMFLAATAKDHVRNRFLSGMPGCSTTTVRSGDQLYFLRNLDYPAASFWEKNQTVFYHEPTEPESQKYVSVSSLGVDIAGLTGWNASGIAVSLHAHFSKKTSLNGVPIFFLLEEILETARTVEDAISICKKFKTIGSWAVNLTHFKEKRALTIELVKGDVFVRESEAGCGISHSNVFQSPEFKKDEIYFSGSFFEDCEARKYSLEAGMNRLAKNFSWSDALALLGSHVDPLTGKKRVFGNTISVVTTIQSVGFDHEAQCLYLSTRAETPVGLGPYLKLPFDFSDLKLDQTPEMLSTTDHHSEAFLSASHYYHQAYVSWQVRSEEPKVAHAYLIQATDALPSDPHLQLQRGYFEMIDGQAQEALSCFEAALKEDLSEHLRQVGLYFRGACFDLLGEREKAIQDYQAVVALKNVDQKLAKKAKKRFNRPYKAGYCKKIEPDLQFAEPIEYV